MKVIRFTLWQLVDTQHASRASKWTDEVLLEVGSNLDLASVVVRDLAQRYFEDKFGRTTWQEMENDGYQITASEDTTLLRDPLKG